MSQSETTTTPSSSLEDLRLALHHAEIAVTSAAMIDNFARRERELAAATAYRDRVAADLRAIEAK